MNYVLFFPDELRAESIACYGHPAVKTPNMDALAAEGTLFEQNYTQHPVCMASRCALITGLYPHNTGHRTLKFEVGEHEHNFFEELRRAGHTVGFFGKNHMFTQESFAKSVDELSPMTFGHIGTKQPDGSTIDNPDPKASAAPATRPVTDPAERKKNNLLIKDPINDEVAARAEDSASDERNILRGIDFIRRHAHEEKPFFLFLPIGNPHPPYAVVESMYDMYDPDSLPMRSLDWLKSKPALYETYRRYHEVDDLSDAQALKKINAVYHAMVSYTDMLLGQIIDELKAQGIYEDTTVILCSDHGDWAGECGLVEKWPSALDEMLTHVPLIIRRPGGVKGHRVTSPTQSIDIFPTVMDWEGLDIGWDQFGVSLRPQTEGAEGDEDRVVYAEGGYNIREPHCFEGTAAYAALMVDGTRYYAKMLQQQEAPDTVCRSVMRRDGRYKFIFRTNGEGELYDMQADPKEYVNLYNDPDFAPLRARLTEETLRWLVDTSDTVPHEGH